MCLKIEDIRRAVLLVAEANAYHPVRAWLDGLRWDKTLRVRHWLRDYAGAADDDYTSEVAQWWMVSAVARIYKPGCKVDHMLILEGEQGIRKSSLLEAICPERSLFRDTPIDLGHKDSFGALRGKWILEWAELDSLDRSDFRKVKAYVSSPVDSYRPPYAKRDVDAERQCVFAGTTNEPQYFPDPTGNRRFWPVRCTRADPEELSRVREQLWAEAVHWFQEGAQWWPSTSQSINRATDAQEQRRKEHPWEATIAIFLATRAEVCVGDVLDHLNLSKKDWTPGAATVVGQCLARAGWIKKRRGSGSREWFWAKG
jgi:putative DNA primase/helicase